MTGEPDGLTAVLLQLAGITQKLSELDQRQGIDTRELKDRHGALASLVGELKGTTASHAETLAGQAEWHTRLLAAAAEQLARETHGCAHGTSRYRIAPSGSRP